MNRSIGLSCLLVLVGAANAAAEKNADLPAKLATLPSASIHETFDAELASPLLGVKGEWRTKDGELIGTELAADKHAAVFSYQKPNHNSVVRFSFKFDGTTDGMNFSLNRTMGHLFRVVITPTGLAVNLDKDKKDASSKVVSLARAKANFQPRTWYTMQVEMVGDRVVVQVDNGVTVEATHPSLDTKKPNYRFVMKGDWLAIDDLMIWELN